MTTIVNNGGFYWGSRTIKALAEATGTRYVYECGKGKTSGGVYFADGYKFTPKQFGEYMLKQANEWMIENGLVDLEKIASINSRYITPIFTINE